LLVLCLLFLIVVGLLLIIIGNLNKKKQDSLGRLALTGYSLIALAYFGSININRTGVLGS